MKASGMSDVTELELNPKEDKSNRGLGFISSI